MELLFGDCLELMPEIKDNSVDLLFCDLPYGQTSCKWDCLIDLEQFWKQVNRICKDDAPMLFTCSVKFGNTLINSNPKCFRYDLIFVKSKSCNFLNSKKQPMKKHEMVYVFYRKLPKVYTENISLHHTHKFIKETENKDYEKRTIKKRNTIKKEENYGKEYLNKKVNYRKYDPTLGGKPESHIYDPPLPNSLLEYKSEGGKHSTQKPVTLMEWILKYYSREGGVVLDPTMGSGSMGVACKNMNRYFIGIEKDEKIFEVAMERLND